MFRKMRRFKQQLTEEECRKVLSEGRRGTLAVNGDDGYPYTFPLNYYYDEANGCIFFHGAAEGHKIDAIQKSDKVSFNVLSQGWRSGEDWWMQFNSITVFGRIQIVEDKKAVENELRAIGRKYYPDEASVEAEIQQLISRVCVLKLIPEYITGKHVNEK